MERPQPGSAPPSPHARLRHSVTERAVLEAIAADGPLSRAELARRTSMSPPTVSEAVRRLDDASIVTVVGRRVGRAGAVPDLYGLGREAGAAIGVELTSTTLRVATVDVTGRDITPVECAEVHGSERVVDQVNRMVDQTVATVTEGGVPVRAVAVSVANPVDPITGAVVELPESVFPRGVIARSALRVADGTTAVIIDNDVNLAALAEGEHGAARDAGTFAYLHVDRGRSVGLGVVVDGQVVRGARGLAGEIGYLPVATTSGVGGRFGLSRALGDIGLDPDRPAATHLDEVGRILGEAAAATCAILDPQMIVLGGRIGTTLGLAERVGTVLDGLAPRVVPVVVGAVTDSAPLAGALITARHHAWDQLVSDR